MIILLIFSSSSDLNTVSTETKKYVIIKLGVMYFMKYSQVVVRSIIWIKYLRKFKIYNIIWRHSWLRNVVLYVKYLLYLFILYIQEPYENLYYKQSLLSLFNAILFDHMGIISLDNNQNRLKTNTQFNFKFIIVSVLVLERLTQ